MRRLQQIIRVLLLVFIAELCFAASTYAAESIPVEVFQVHQLPVTVTNVELVRAGSGSASSSIL